MHLFISRVRRTLLFAALLTGSVSTTNAQQIAVDLELALLVDVSGSVDNTEFNLQRSGYFNTFNSSALFDNFIGTLPTKSIAVSFVYWSSVGQQAQLGGTGNWFLVNSVASSQAFASSLNSFARPFSGGTEPHGAINFITPQFASNPFTAPRWVIDVSGDGAGSTAATLAARNAALAAGVRNINGLAILGEPGLEAWYQANIRGGPESFVAVASDFASFETAVGNKIGAEIINVVPEPSTYALTLIGLGAMLAIAKRRRVS